jgi:hypothetical protein
VICNEDATISLYPGAGLQPKEKVDGRIRSTEGGPRLWQRVARARPAASKRPGNPGDDCTQMLREGLPTYVIGIILALGILGVSYAVVKTLGGFHAAIDILGNLVTRVLA